MTFHAIGLMSGTSLDGLDICYTQFQKNENTWNYQIICAETIPYSSEEKEKLTDAIHLKSEDLLSLNSEYGFFIGEKIQQFITKNKITVVDVISSHGHTIFHQPNRKFTLQIGDGRAIKILNPEIPVVYDFRSQDVLLGGNGAPFVPIGDELLFHEFDACINLGGFSNISFKKDGKRIAFDICPVNIPFNFIANKLGKTYDEKGEIAKSGTIDQELLNELNQLDFYELNAPKSLGIEWFLNQFLPLLKGSFTNHTMATIVEHVAEQISKILNQHQFKTSIITGGGAHHEFLIEKIRNKTSCEIIIPENKIIDFKEALIFALMGVLRINNEVNVLSSATGSSHDHITGIIA